MGENLYKTAGTSVKKGVKKLRLANISAADRYKILHKDGHEDIRLFDLPHEMTAEQAQAWLEAQGDVVPDHTPKKASAPKEKPEASGRPKPAPKAPVARTGKAGGRKGQSDSPVDFWGTDWSEVDREVSAEVEERAKKIQSTDFLSFMPWDVVSAAVRNEYRMKAERELGVATRQGEPA